MHTFCSLLMFMVLLPPTLSGSIAGMNFIPIDRFGNDLFVGGAQPYGIYFFLKLSGKSLAAGDIITLSPEKALFQVPSGQLAAKVTRWGSAGADCWANYTKGTTTSLTWTLNLLDGACSVPENTVLAMTIPQSLASTNPAAGTVKLFVSATGTSTSYGNVVYQAYGVIYATADPRNMDNSASYLMGGGQPSFMNIGFTTTWLVNAGAVIQLASSNTAFRRPGSNKFAIPINGTGCTATLTTTNSGVTSQLRFALSGSSCQIAPNVAVAGEQFQLPAALLNVNPADTTVSITVTVIVGQTSYSASNGNPATYATTSGCDAWSSWSSCSATCGSGYTFRTRTALTTACPSTIATRSCNTIACGCTSWSSWGSCSATCGGIITRSRLGAKNCNVATVDTQSCGPTSCSCPWTQTQCSSSCGSGVRTRKDCKNNAYQVVCNETFTTESLACPCQDIPWTDRFGSTCSDYVNNNWCTVSGTYGPGWDFTKPGFRSFDYRTNDGNNALTACCGCGKNKCVKDVVLLVDQSGSIAQSDWAKMHQYITDRVNQTKFTDENGNRIGVAQFDNDASVLCPLTWDQKFLLKCIAGITFPAGWTATSAGLNLVKTIFDRHSSPNRTRVVELLTDGSPNVPAQGAVEAAYQSAYALKDDGVTIVTIGMGIACATPTSNDCLNREVLNTMASEPTSSYAVLLASYDSLKAMSLFISSQCTAQLAGFDPSPSPIPQFSPEPSTSPSASPSAAASASPRSSISPSPRASASISPVPSVSPVASSSPTPSSSSSPAASASFSPGASVSPVPSISPTASTSPKPSISPVPSASPLPSASPAASAVPSISPEASTSADPSISPAPSASPLPSISPAASASPVPSVSPAASTSSKPSISPAPSASPLPSASPAASASPVPSVSPATSTSPAASPVASPSTSPGASPSPEASVSAQPSQSGSPVPSPSPVPSASPAAEAQCKAQEELVPADWYSQAVGCSRDDLAYLLRQYQCIEFQPSCGVFQCSLHVPPSVVQQIKVSCNSV